jgi:hypothetical protein
VINALSKVDKYIKTLEKILALSIANGIAITNVAPRQIPVPAVVQPVRLPLKPIFPGHPVNRAAPPPTLNRIEPKVVSIKREIGDKANDEMSKKARIDV